ncbi:flagellar biosynthesis protein FlhF [Neptuniibacter sp. CAU 1671]|uniref:flagellar biosynthesis protein FlhF n=1 Tax=Neptuniibacter sp. CAU 1671 TaxID=3032593 RepID=UPI0023DA0E51|nr:flagellar biosynthesis protein FlhF [Neptuniibacter sp. CAU 1671]MDF2181364.1 flagellar biosynthesis protein FlhF [Neptuniibacter sp. CAU 1671]
MKVKRFFAPDMRQAMRRVREEIGPDAVILSNHRVSGGVEVVAAHENDYETARAEFDQRQRPAPSARQPLDVVTGAQSAGLSDELHRARMRIAEAQQRAHAPADETEKVNRQLGRDDEDDLRMILSTLKQRRREKADAAHENFVRQQLPEPEMHAPATAMDANLIRTMQDEIQQLKQMLQHQAMSQVAKPVSPLQRKLELMGISPALAGQLMSGVEPDLAPEKAWRNMLAKLSEAIPVVGEEYIERGGMIAFVGPTGSGKTTTIGKLAARYVLQHGSSGLALVTTDTYRIAAHEQLRTFGRILDVPVRVVDENSSLEAVLQSLKNKRLVLIDTAGLCAQEPHSETQMSMLESVTLRLKKLLVVSCSSQRRVVEQAYQAYRELGLNGCVLSKMDESGGLGEALSLIIEKRLPVAYMTDGQRIPDDIQLAKRHDLVSRAVVAAQKALVQERQSDDDSGTLFKVV